MSQPASRSFSRAWWIAFAIALAGTPIAARAQDGTDAEPAPSEEAPSEEAQAEAQPEAQPAETLPANAERPPEHGDRAPAAHRPAPPPIMVVVLPSGRVSDDEAAAAQQALVDQLGPMAGGRPVLALGAAQVRDAIAACEDDTCIGGQLAEAGVQAGMIARLNGRGRRPIQATLELRDPVSGVLRHEPVAGELPRDTSAIPAAMATLSAQLEGSIPNPPPPPSTLMVTVNVDGARVQVDGEDVGVSPVAPVDVAQGTHEVVVLAPGYLSARRQAHIAPGEQARVDVTLEEVGSGADLSAAMNESGSAGGDVTNEWWFWPTIGVGAAVVIGVIIGVIVAASSGGGQTPDPNGFMLPNIVGGM